MKKLYSQSGFTLLEIIIAISILAAMTITMTEITTGIALSRDRANKRNEARHGISIGLSKIMDDVRQAFHTQKKFQGRNNVFLSGFKGDSVSMNFSTMSNIHFVKNNRDTDQIHVGYELRSNDRGSFDLVRRQTDYLVEDLEQGGRGFVLVPNVKEFTLEYYDSNKESWQGEWSTESISSGGRLPQIVKVMMTVLGENIGNEDNEDVKEYYYELLVPIEMYKDKINF